MKELVIQITHGAGLHARPLAAFVKVARAYESAIKVKNLTTGKGPSDGKSPLNLMLLVVKEGNEILITADGPDEEAALAALSALIASDFEMEGEQ